MAAVRTDYADVIVVGLGPGGEDAAGRLSEAGLDVIGVEERLVGGERSYYGCIPTTIMAHAAGLLAEGRRIAGHAGTAMVHPEYRLVVRSLREATDDWDDKAAVDRLTGRGVRFLRGTGRLTAPDEVTVADTDGDGDETVVHARQAIVLSVGGGPVLPPIPGLAGTPYWTSHDAVRATELPGSLLVLGSSVVGLEIGQAWSRFGAAVTVAETLSGLLPGEEPEAGALLAGALAEEGVQVRTDTRVRAVSHAADTGFTLYGEPDGQQTAERLLIATGRRPELAKLGVTAIGADPTAAALPVDDRLRVVPPVGGRPGIWALGGATGKGSFPHLSVYQADIVVRGILGEGGAAASYHAVPRVIRTDPQIGAVGLTEAQAWERGMQVLTGFAEPEAPGGTGQVRQSGGPGFVKVVADAVSGCLVGATVAGPCGGEALGTLAVAVHARVPLPVLGEQIWAYSTFHRAIGAALADLAPAQRAVTGR